MNGGERSQWFSSFIGLAISVLAIFLALRNVDLVEVWRVLSHVQAGWIAWALFFVAASHGIKTLRWRILLGSPAKNLSWLSLFSALSISQMFNILLPLRLGELHRIWALGRAGPGRSFVLGTIVVEKFFDLLVLGAMFVALLLIWPAGRIQPPPWLAQPGGFMVVLTILISLFLFLAIAGRAWIVAQAQKLAKFLPQRWQGRLLGGLQNGLRSLKVLRQPASWAALALTSTSIWAAAALTNHMVLFAMGVELPVTASLLILIALQFVFSLPAAPGKLGTFELTCIVSLAVFGVQQPLALSYGILLHAIAYLPVVLAGLFFIWRYGFRGLAREEVG